jgi:hypothetical protein
VSLHERQLLYCGVFAQSKNCGGREIAVARQCRHATIEEVSRYVTCTAVAIEQLSKYVSALTNTCNNKRAVFSVRSVPRVYKKNKECHLKHPRVGEGSNTSTVNLRVVGGDEKGSLESETVKYSHESHGTRTRE